MKERTVKLEQTKIGQWRAEWHNERGEYVETVCKAWTRDECARLAVAQGFKVLD